VAQITVCGRAVASRVTKILITKGEEFIGERVLAMEELLLECCFQLRRVTLSLYKACPSESETEVGAALSARGPMGHLFQPTRRLCVDSMCYTDIVTYVLLFNL
jgi:hypothetical protein